MDEVRSTMSDKAQGKNHYMLASKSKTQGNECNEKNRLTQTQGNIQQNE